MTSALPEITSVPTLPQPSDIQVEVANTSLPLGMRLDLLRSHALRGVRRARPHLPAFPAVAPVVPAVGATALGMLLLRDRRRHG